MKARREPAEASTKRRPGGEASPRLDLNGLIALAYCEPRPSAEARRRMDRKLAPLLTAGAGSMLLEPSVELRPDRVLGIGSAPRGGPWESFTASTLGKSSLGLMSVALMVGAFWVGRTTSKRAGLAAPVEPQTVSASDVPRHPELVVMQRELAPAEPEVNAVPAKAVPTPIPRSPAANKVRKAPDGLAVLANVELALREGNPKQALAGLEQLGEPASIPLRHLARILRAVALCNAGRLAEGRRLAAQIQAEGESSVFAARLERACELERLK